MVSAELLHPIPPDWQARARFGLLDVYETLRLRRLHGEAARVRGQSTTVRGGHGWVGGATSSTGNSSWQL